MERNRCTDSGCLGYCCQNIDIEITKSERTRLFPKAREVGSISELANINTAKTPGVFYTKYSRDGLKNGDFYIISINGPCPNRLPNGSCSKHEEREYAARNFSIGCSDCNAIRAEHSLHPIFVEPVE